MSDVTQAMVFTEPGKLEMRTDAAPTAGAGEIVIEVAACGVCRTDLQIFKGDIPLRKERHVISLLTERNHFCH